MKFLFEIDESLIVVTDENYYPSRRLKQFAEADIPPQYVKQYLRNEAVALAAVDLPADTHAIVYVERDTGDFRYWYITTKSDRDDLVLYMAQRLGSFAALHP